MKKFLSSVKYIGLYIYKMSADAIAPALPPENKRTNLNQCM